MSGGSDASPGYSAMDGLVSETYTMLVKTQQEHGLSEGLKIPQLVLVGVQSTGKSTFLESLVGFAITYKQNSTGTRCPTMVTLKTDNTIPKEEQEGRRVFVDGKETPIGNLESTLRDHMEKVKGTRHGFDITPVKVEIHAPNVPKLVIFDMPGLIPNSDDPDVAKEIEEIVATYVRNPLNIVVVMAACTCDRGSIDGFDRINSLAIKDEFTEKTGFPPRRDWAKHGLVFVNKWNLQFPGAISTVAQANAFFHEFSTTNTRGVGREDHVFITLVPGDMVPTRSDGSEIKPGDFKNSFQESIHYYATLPVQEKQYIDAVKARLSSRAAPGERWNSRVNDVMLGIKRAHGKLIERLEAAILDNLGELTQRVEQLLREENRAIQNLEGRLKSQDEASAVTAIHHFLEDFLFHFQMSLNGESVQERWWNSPSHNRACGSEESSNASEDEWSDEDAASDIDVAQQSKQLGEGAERRRNTGTPRYRLDRNRGKNAHPRRADLGSRTSGAPEFERGADLPTKTYLAEECGVTWAQEVERLTIVGDDRHWDGYLDPTTLQSPDYLGFPGSPLATVISMRLFGVSAFRRAMTLFQYMLLSRPFQHISRENIYVGGNKAHVDNQFASTDTVMKMAIDHLDQAHQGVFWLGNLLHKHFSDHGEMIFDHLIGSAYYAVLPGKVKKLLRNGLLQRFRRLLDARLKTAHEVYSRIYKTYKFYRPVDQMKQQLMLALVTNIDNMLPGPDRLGVPMKGDQRQGVAVSPFSGEGHPQKAVLEASEADETSVAGSLQRAFSAYLEFIDLPSILSPPENSGAQDKLAPPSYDNIRRRLAEEGKAAVAAATDHLDPEQEKDEIEKVKRLVRKHVALKIVQQTISTYNEQGLFKMADVVAPGQQQITQVDYDFIPYEVLRRSAHAYYCSFVVELTQLLHRIFTAEFLHYLTQTYDNNIAHDMQGIARDIVGVCGGDDFADKRSKTNLRKWKAAMEDPGFQSLKSELRKKKAAQRELRKALANLQMLARQRPHLVSRPPTSLPATQGSNDTEVSPKTAQQQEELSSALDKAKELEREKQDLEARLKQEGDERQEMVERLKRENAAALEKLRQELTKEFADKEAKMKADFDQRAHENNQSDIEGSRSSGE